MTTNLALELFKRNGTYEILMKKTFRSPLCTPLWNMSFWKLEKGKKSRIHNDALVLFPPFRLFGGWCLGCTAEKGMTWLWCDLLARYFTELIQLKYKLILWVKTMGCCGLACVVWLKSCEFSKRKSVLISGKSSMMCLLQKFLNLTYMWTFFIFYETEWTCWVFLLPVRS